MSSLIVLCPHCLTWIETHAECCTECGAAVNVEDNDPSDAMLAEQLGERLVDLGPVKLLRRGWPNGGRLLATTRGLLFVPAFVLQPTGALEAAAEEAPDGAVRVANLFQWWSLPPWRRPVESRPPKHFEAASIPLQPVLQLLLDSPGAVFIHRESIRQIIVRRGRAQIERRPLRSVSLIQAPGGVNPRDSLKQLIEFAPWRAIVAGL